MTHLFKLCLVPLLTFACIGCGGNEDFPTATVKGRVTCQGEPLAQMNVVFTPVATGSGLTGKAGTAETDEDGYYSLTTFSSGDGAIIGKHTVAVMTLDPAAQVDCTLPSDLEREVVAGGNEINIELE